jgi:hypothetical protein
MTSGEASERLDYSCLQGLNKGRIFIPLMPEIFSRFPLLPLILYFKPSPTPRCQPSYTVSRRYQEFQPFPQSALLATGALQMPF